MKPGEDIPEIKHRIEESSLHARRSSSVLTQPLSDKPGT
jgi:hypothetical protein